MIDLSNLKIRQDIDRVHLLQWGHFSLILLAFLVEGIINFEPLGMIVKIVCGLIFYKLYFKTLTDLYYSFWTFSAALSIYITGSLYLIITNQSDFQLFYLYLVSLIILCVQMYILLSPIYYPRVSWWEYDFRYKDDLKIKIRNGEEDSEARLTDLRRGAACLSSFSEINVGELIKIHASNGVKDFVFEVEIMSKRQYSLGRPVSHGVKFVFNEESKEDDYDEFIAFWAKEKIEKSKRRFVKKATNA